MFDIALVVLFPVVSVALAILIAWFVDWVVPEL